jgi:hypothetical protein
MAVWSTKNCRCFRADKFRHKIHPNKSPAKKIRPIQVRLLLWDRRCNVDVCVLFYLTFRPKSNMYQNPPFISYFLWLCNVNISFISNAKWRVSIRISSIIPLKWYPIIFQSSVNNFKFIFRPKYCAECSTSTIDWS